MTQTPYVDLSHPIEPDTPPFPGDPQVEIRVLATTEDSVPEGGVACNTSQVVMPIHCGTHMDAPYHFFGDGITIDRVDLSRCTGSAVLLKLPPNTDVIGVKHLEPYAHLFSEHPRVIFNTGWSKQWKAKNFFTEHSVISTDAAELLVQSKVQLVGVDFSFRRLCAPFDARCSSRQQLADR